MAELPERPPQKPIWTDRALALTAVASGVLNLLASAKDLPLLDAVPPLVRWSVTLVFVAYFVSRWLVARRRRLQNLVIKKPDELKIPDDDFRGRRTDVDRIVPQLLESNVFCLLGESGCGKSTLVARGLAMDARITERLNLVTVSSYGADWVMGPSLALAAALKLEPEENLRTLLSRLKRALTLSGQTASLPFLLVFDQFDQYLAASHDNLVRDGLYIDQATLVEVNPLWKMIFQLAGKKVIKCLFVIESKQGLLALPFFAGAARAPLTRLGAEHARGLLLTCLERAEGATTDDDFSDLVERIARDLDKKGLLPVELDFAVRSLPHLTPPTLKSYYRIGGLAGLVALGIQRQIESFAPFRGFTYPEALLLLSYLAAGGKLQERRLEELTGALSTHPPEAIEDLLNDLKRRRITRGDAPAWTLYHEFLVDVLATLRENARQQEALIRDMLDKYRTSPSVKGKLRSLLALPPWSTFPYVAGRRNRLRIAEARSFLLTSLLAWVAVASLACTALGWLYVWGRTELVGPELALRFDSTSYLNRQELEALWRLHDEWRPVKRKALMTFLESEASAGRFESHEETLLQSLIGLDPDAMQASLMIVWRERCLERKDDLEENGLDSCALLENELPTARLETWDRYLLFFVPQDVLVSLFGKLPEGEQEGALGMVAQRLSSRWISGDSVAELLTRVSRQVRDRQIDGILAGYVKRGSLLELADLRRSFREKGGFDLDNRIEAAGRQLIASMHEKERPLQWAQQIGELPGKGWKVETSIWEEARAVLVSSLAGDLSLQSKLEVLAYLEPFAGDLAEKDLSLAREIFVAGLGDCDTRDASPFLRPPWVFKALNGEDALKLLERLETRPFIQGEQWWVQEPLRADVVKHLGELFRKIPADQRERKRRDLWNRLLQAEDLSPAVHLLVLLGAIDRAERQDGLVGEDLMAELLRLVKADEEIRSLDALALCAQSWWPYLSPKERRQLGNELSRLYVQSLRRSQLRYQAARLAGLLSQLDLSLPAAESEALLTRLLKSSEPPCGALTPLVRQETLRLLVEQGFRHPACPLGISPTVLEKLDRSGIVPIERIGERCAGKVRADRKKLAVWARESGYDLDGPLLFGGALY